MLPPGLTGATTPIADRGHDSNKVRKLLADQGVTARIPPGKNRKEQIPCCEQTRNKRHEVENMFAKLKDWRRIATRYDRCAHTFMSAIHIAATVIILAMSPEPS